MSQNTCSCCGEADLVAGTLQSTGTIMFRPLEAKFLTFRTADVVVQARMCPSCGGVGLVGDTAKLDHLKNSSNQPQCAASGGDHG